ncbi:MAG: MmcQ/YjbR family DNA-binding protein [Candidatus Limimorpha sp.]
MNVEDVRDFALSLDGVTEDMPFGDDLVTFRVEGKIFMALSLDVENVHLTLKLLPERNEEMRSLYSEITPAWHWNKKHWSDIAYSGGFPDTLLMELISESYSLIIKKLPLKLREKYSKCNTPLS